MPEPEWAPFIVQWAAYGDPKDIGGAEPHKTLARAIKDAKAARRDGFSARILRVQPPVTRRVEIDWEAVNRDRDEFVARGDFAGGLPVWLKESIEAHARVVEEPK